MAAGKLHISHNGVNCLIQSDFHKFIISIEPKSPCVKTATFHILTVNEHCDP